MMAIPHSTNIGSVLPQVSILLLIGLLAAPASRAQVLFVDTFDANNVAGAPPDGWAAGEPDGTHARVVDDAVLPVHSVPFAVELVDDSPVTRPTLQRAFAATPAGVARFRARINTRAEAPLYMHARTAGAFLFAIVLSDNGLAGYDNTATGTVHTSTAWTPGRWHDVRVHWYEDRTFDAWLDGQRFVVRAAFSEFVDPTRILFASGYSDAVGRRGYIDHVSVGALLLADDFGADNAPGAPPSGWTVTDPEDTLVRIVSVDTIEPATPPFAVELVDDSPTSRPQMVRSFAPAPVGTASFRARLEAHDHGPLQVQLRAADGAFLCAISFQRNGTIGTLASPGGAGDNVQTGVGWATGVWHTVRVEWRGPFTFSAWLDDTPLAEGVAFGAADRPGEIRFASGFGEAVDRRGYVDDVTVAPDALASVRGLYAENAVWISGRYRFDTSWHALIPGMADQMRRNGVRYWFVNMGSVDSSGRMWTDLKELDGFLNTVHAWEQQHNHRFEVIAWINGRLNADHERFIDVTDAGVRAAIVDECGKFVSSTVEDSYITGADRIFDGIHFDFEPSGGDTNRLAGLLTMLEDTRSALTSLGLPGGGHISFAASRYAEGGTSEWRWTPHFYYEMGRRLDSIGVMLYSTTITNAQVYQDLHTQQVRDILRAVSGRYWADGTRPWPTNNIRIFMGFPAYEEHETHDPDAEHIIAASLGADAGMTALLNEGDPSAAFFGGAVVFRHTTGTGELGDAAFDGEWWDFRRYWIGDELAMEEFLPRFRVAPAAETGGLRLTWIARGGRGYVVEASDDGPGGPFAPIGPVIHVPGAHLSDGEFVDADTETIRRRFYRVRLAE